MGDGCGTFGVRNAPFALRNWATGGAVSHPHRPPQDRRRLVGFRQTQLVQVDALSALVHSAAGQKRLRPVRSHHETKVVEVVVQGVREVLGHRPGGVVQTAGQVEVGSAQAQMAVRGKVETASVGVQKRRRLHAGRINRGRERSNVHPAPLAQFGPPNVCISLALTGFAHKKELATVGRQAGLGLPLGSIDCRAGVLGFRPGSVSAPDAEVNVAGSVAVTPLTGRKGHDSLVAANAHCTFVSAGIQASGKRLGCAPVHRSALACENHLIALFGALARRKVKGRIVA